jgi:glycerol-3-phosphate acyltransferase PlsY
MAILTCLFACCVAYLIGSVAFALVSARLFHLADPRTYGSGNPGATNVLRSGHKGAAFFTLLGDTFKGAFAVLMARFLGLGNFSIAAFSDPEIAVGLVGLAAYFGHLYPVFLKFKGGKGVATAGGVMLAFTPLAGLSVLGIWILAAILTRYSSLASILAAILAPPVVLLLGGSESQAVVVGVMGMGLILKHWGNIRRLIAGEETKIGSKKKGSETSEHHSPPS